MNGIVSYYTPLSHKMNYKNVQESWELRELLQ